MELTDEMRVLVINDMKERLRYDSNDEYAIGAYGVLGELNATALGQSPVRKEPDTEITEAMKKVHQNREMFSVKNVSKAFNAAMNLASHTPLQQQVQPWMMECFGPEIAADCQERNHRFFEEATELVQACGMTASEAHQLVEYVYGRPIGEKNQEIGGVMITLAALCLAQGLDMHQEGETELARIWTKVTQIRAKQASKPHHSPLPE